MTNVEGPTDWRDLREFASVDLTQSFLLSCAFESSSLMIDVDLFLTPEHPLYEKPRPAQRVCIRPAVIEFPYCESLRTAGSAKATESAAVARGIQHGPISGLRRIRDGQYELSGRFGTLLIDAERPLLRLKNA
jgi:hypothetical protein